MTIPARPHSQTPTLPTPDSRLPLMSRQEASWHETMAGIRAKTAAQEQGAAPSAIQALLDSSTRDGLTIGPVTLKRATKGTALALQHIATAFAAWAKDLNIPQEDRAMLEDGIAAIIFIDSENAWTRFQRHGIEPFVTEAQDLTWTLDLDVLDKINKHVYTEMTRISSLTPADEPGKPRPQEAPIPAGPSAGTQTPPPEMTSPPSSGSCQSTDSIFTMPSGSSPSPQPSSSCPPVTSATEETPAPPTPQTPASPPETNAAPG